MSPAIPRWCVELNECGLNSSAAAGAAAWWFQQRLNPLLERRIKVIGAAPPGELVQIFIDGGRDDAEFFCTYLIAKGIPKTFVKVKRRKQEARA